MSGADTWKRHPRNTRSRHSARPAYAQKEHRLPIRNPVPLNRGSRLGRVVRAGQELTVAAGSLPGSVTGSSRPRCAQPHPAPGERLNPVRNDVRPGSIGHGRTGKTPAVITAVDTSPERQETCGSSSWSCSKRFSQTRTAYAGNRPGRLHRVHHPVTAQVTPPRAPWQYRLWRVL
jgi:hypothetical protein